MKFGPKNPKLVFVLKSDSDSKCAGVSPKCNCWPIQLYYCGRYECMAIICCIYSTAVIAHLPCKSFEETAAVKIRKKVLGGLLKMYAAVLILQRLELIRREANIKFLGLAGPPLVRNMLNIPPALPACFLHRNPVCCIRVADDNGLIRNPTRLTKDCFHDAAIIRTYHNFSIFQSGVGIFRSSTYCMMHISVPFSAGRSFVGFRIQYYVSKLFLPIGENTKEFVRNVPGV